MATHVSDTGSKGRSRGSSSDELAMIAQRAQAFTNASGTAIALSEGSLDEITCRARSGSSAPEVGTAMRVEGSFTGLCIQSGKELRCDDTETDTRVDNAAVRALGIRSMVVTPIREENRVVGVLAVFAPTAHAFTITHVAVLKTMADQISALLQKERKAREEGATSEPAPPAVPAAASQPVPAAPSTPLPSPVVMTPAVPSASPLPTPRPAFPVISRKVEPIKTTVVAEEIATPVMLPKRDEKPRMEARAGLASFDAAGSEEKKSGVSLLLVAVVALVVVGGSIFAYLRMHKAPATASIAPHSQEPANIAAPQPAGATVSPAPANSGAASTNNPQPATVAASSAPAPKPVIDNSAAERARREEKNPPKNNNASNANSAPERSAPEKHPETVALSTAPSKIATPSPDAGQSQDSAPALNLGGPGAAGSGALSALTKSASGTKPSMLTQSELEPVQVLKRVAPIYPAIAKQRRLSGILVVQAMVGKDGKIANLELVSGPPVFKDAAFDAIKQWQFKPAMLNGQPIDQSTQIRLQFNP